MGKYVLNIVVENLKEYWGEIFGKSDKSSA